MCHSGDVLSPKLTAGGYFLDITAHPYPKEAINSPSSVTHFNHQGYIITRMLERAIKTHF
jgi:hypothetical protein